MPFFYYNYHSVSHLESGISEWLWSIASSTPLLIYILILPDFILLHPLAPSSARKTLNITSFRTFLHYNFSFWFGYYPYPHKPIIPQTALVWNVNVKPGRETKVTAQIEGSMRGAFRSHCQRKQRKSDPNPADFWHDSSEPKILYLYHNVLTHTDLQPLTWKKRKSTYGRHNRAQRELTLFAALSCWLFLRWMQQTSLAASPLLRTCCCTDLNHHTPNPHPVLLSQHNAAITHACMFATLQGLKNLFWT